MKTLKGWITTTCLATILTISPLDTRAGVIITEATPQTPCSGTTSKVGKVDYGVIITGLTGVIITGFTGIIIIGAAESPQTDCGIIITG